ncbi:MAG: sulfur oxidation c-type cytochrome SoxA [Campylobacterota bacterium]|nr:sulfur oxidation c-type cytochrome SoxA [Campylobacterota bacterium]
MLLKIVKSSVLVAVATCTLNAGDFNAQAEKDRKALEAYTVAKFADPVKDRYSFFPYSTDDELKNNIVAGIKAEEFAIGNYAFSKQGKFSYDEIKEMPPYEDFVEAGEEIYENSAALKACFPDVTIGGDYPYFDDAKKEVVTLTSAINACVVAAGEKKWGEKKGKMANLQAFISYSTMEAEKKVNIKIQSAEAAAAYERGKQEYYTERGYLNLSCATCHVQGAGKRVRNESLSQLLGHTTHFPVFRLKWGAKDKNSNGLGTLERRMEGCNKDQGENPHKTNSKWMKELLYFMAYMSNGMNVDGPDVRK